jgi:Phage major capsid protein E
MGYEDPKLLHEDEVLTQISVEYQREYRGVGPLFAPSVFVGKQSDKYRIFNNDNAPRVTDDVRAPGAAANELPPLMMRKSEETYYAESHALKDYVPIEEQANADDEVDGIDIDPMEDSTTRLTDTILLNRDYTVAQLVLNTANYAAGHTVTLAGAQQWDDPASNPITDTRTGRRKVRDALGRTINRVVMGFRVTDALEDHPRFLERLGGGWASLQLTDEQIIARILRIPEGQFVTIDDRYNTSPYGTAAVFGEMWGNHVWIGFVPDRPRPRTPAFMYEFVWRTPTLGRNAATGTDGLFVSRWWDNDRRSDAIQVDRYYDHKFIAVDGTGKSIAGYLIKDAV